MADSTGTLELNYVYVLGEPLGLEILRADRVIEIADDLLEDLASIRPEVSLGDGILTIRGFNRTVSYGLGRHDPCRAVTLGYLSEAEDHEAEE